MDNRIKDALECARSYGVRGLERFGRADCGNVAIAASMALRTGELEHLRLVVQLSRRWRSPNREIIRRHIQDGT